MPLIFGAVCWKTAMGFYVCPQSRLSKRQANNCLVHFYKRCVSGIRCRNICSISSKVNEDQFSKILLLSEYSLKSINLYIFLNFWVMRNKNPTEYFKILPKLFIWVTLISSIHPLFYIYSPLWFSLDYWLVWGRPKGAHVISGLI